MKMPPKRVVVATGLLLSLVGVGLAFWSYPNIADADHDDVQLASIASVRAHPITSGPITTVAHLAARGGCPTTTVAYESDGLKTYALAMRPKTKMPTNGYPVIIFAHGYTNPARYRTDNSQYENMLTWFCGHNFLVLKPDYRGHGMSEGVAVNGLYSPSDTFDVLNLAASLANYAPADSHHIALVGHSMGGGVVLRAAVAPHGLHFTALVTIAGAVDSLTNMTYHWQGHVPPDVALKRSQILQQEGPPSQNPGYWLGGSAINYVGSLEVPVQIHQGLSDASVPTIFAVHLDQALTSAGKRHELYFYPSTGHLFTNTVALSTMLTRTTTFITTADQ